MTISSQQYRVNMYVGYGPSNADRTLVDSQKPVTAVANAVANKIITVTAPATDQAVTFPELDTALVITLRDVTPNATLGVSYQVVSGAATKLKLASGGCTVLDQLAGTAPPTIYLSNSDSVNKAYIEITMIGTKV